MKHKIAGLTEVSCLLGRFGVDQLQLIGRSGLCFSGGLLFFQELEIKGAQVANGATEKRDDGGRPGLQIKMEVCFLGSRALKSGDE